MSEITTIEQRLPEVLQINRGLIARADELAAAVKDEASFQAAADHIKEIDRRLDWWNDFIDPLVKAAHATWKAAVAKRDEIAGPLEIAKKQTLGGAMAKWRREEMDKAAKAHAVAQAAARRAQEEAILASAEQLEKSGNKAAADAVLSTPVMDVKAAPVQPKAAGITFATRYHAEVFDLMALVKEVAAGKVPLAAVEANKTFLNSQARALKGEMQYGGVQVVKEDGIASRRAAF